MDGIDHTGMSFDKYVSGLAHGYSDPPDSKRVKEIEYDPVKIRAAQIEEQRTQALAREIEQRQKEGIGQRPDGHDYGGYSR